MVSSFLTPLPDYEMKQEIELVVSLLSTSWGKITTFTWSIKRENLPADTEAWKTGTIHWIAPLFLEFFFSPYSERKKKSFFSSVLMYLLWGVGIKNTEIIQWRDIAVLYVVSLMPHLICHNRKVRLYILSLSWWYGSQVLRWCITGQKVLR